MICAYIQLFKTKPKIMLPLLFPSLLPFTISAKPHQSLQSVLSCPLLSNSTADYPSQGYPHVLLRWCQLPPDWFPCFCHCSPHPIIHLPHGSHVDDLIENVYQAFTNLPVHLTQESGNCSPLAKSGLLPVFMLTISQEWCLHLEKKKEKNISCLLKIILNSHFRVYK